MNRLAQLRRGKIDQDLAGVTRLTECDELKNRRCSLLRRQCPEHVQWTGRSGGDFSVVPHNSTIGCDDPIGSKFEHLPIAIDYGTVYTNGCRSSVGMTDCRSVFVRMRNGTIPPFDRAVFHHLCHGTSDSFRADLTALCVDERKEATTDVLGRCLLEILA